MEREGVLVVKCKGKFVVIELNEPFEEAEPPARSHREDGRNMCAVPGNTWGEKVETGRIASACASACFPHRR